MSLAEYRKSLAGHQKHQKRAVYRALFPWLLILPAVALRGFTAVYPIADTFRLSLTNLHFVRGTNDFVGLSNYIAIFHDAKILDSLRFTFIFTILSTGLHFIAGLIIASLLNLPLRIKGLLRTVNLLPWAIPTIVMAIAGQYMFQPEFGLVNDLYNFLFSTHSRPVWLSSVWGARSAVILVDVWKNVPFLAIVLLAGMQGIPLELNEAARVDGASGFKIFTSITLPLLAPTMVTMAIFVSLFRLFSFDLVYGLTKGGPGTATSLLAYRTYYDAFNALSFGYAATTAFLLFSMVAILGLIGFGALRFVERRYGS
ncbi:MAG: sugar ABC transporter permease [Firmicutes bacterium]|nr:sugar ABC transporter permease [Bacillota bacterium]